jgi:hypothetical protein
MARRKNVPDEAYLASLLEEVEELISYRHFLGGKEAMKAYELARRISNLIKPEDPAALSDEVRRFISQFAPGIANTRAELRARAEAAEREGAEHIAARNAHAAEVESRLQEAEVRRRAATAVSEVL